MIDVVNEILEYLNRRELESGIKLVREACRKYMLKKTYAGVEKIKRKPIPRKWVDEAYVKQDGNCPRCNLPMLRRDTVGDHKLPLALGGAHNRWNIQAMHSKCNASKGANDMVRESKLAQTGQTRIACDEDGLELDDAKREDRISREQGELI
jgi:5-methylcytosine-specific restriction endonuclease McrA